MPGTSLYRNTKAPCPKLAKFISHPSKTVRMQVGPDLTAYGRSARPYLGDLAVAAAIEEDADVRHTLEAPIETIKRD